MDEQTLKLLAMRAGRTAVRASTAHNMGPAGTLQAARAFLQELDLRVSRVQSEKAFLRLLDEQTEALAAALPSSVQH
jgi:hypothetical protein